MDGEIMIPLSFFLFFLVLIDCITQNALLLQIRYNSGRFFLFFGSTTFLSFSLFTWKRMILLREWRDERRAGRSGGALSC